MRAKYEKRAPGVADHKGALRSPRKTTGRKVTMDDAITAIRTAVADGATAEQKAHGAAACRAILAALGAEPGKPIAMAGAPVPHPLAGIDPGQALDLLIAKLTAALPKDEDKARQATPTAPPDPRGLRIAFVAPPPRQAARGPAQARPTRRGKP